MAPTCLNGPGNQFKVSTIECVDHFSILRSLRLGLDMWPGLGNLLSRFFIYIEKCCARKLHKNGLYMVFLRASFVGRRSAILEMIFIIFPEKLIDLHGEQGHLQCSADSSCRIIHNKISKSCNYICSRWLSIVNIKTGFSVLNKKQKIAGPLAQGVLDNAYEPLII